MKEDAAELARVIEDERALWLVENEVIVLTGDVLGRGSDEAASHAQMKAQPASAAENKKHLLAACFRAAEDFSGKGSGESIRIGPPEDPLLRVKVNAQDLPAETGIPLLAVIIDFGEFRHGVRINKSGRMGSVE